MTACVLKYLVKGVDTSRDTQSGLVREILACLPEAQSVVALPVVDGFAVEIEMADLRPFNKQSFEPYIAEHVLPEAVAIGCKVQDHQLQLLMAHFA